MIYDIYVRMHIQCIHAENVNIVVTYRSSLQFKYIVENMQMLECSTKSFFTQISKLIYYFTFVYGTVS